VPYRAFPRKARTVCPNKELRSIRSNVTELESCDGKNRCQRHRVYTIASYKSESENQNNGGSDRRKDRQHFEARPENGADQNTNDYVDDH
jgi:hypothetical protein